MNAKDLIQIKLHGFDINALVTAAGCVDGHKFHAAFTVDGLGLLLMYGWDGERYHFRTKVQNDGTHTENEVKEIVEQLAGMLVREADERRVL